MGALVDLFFLIKMLIIKCILEFNMKFLAQVNNCAKM